MYSEQFSDTLGAGRRNAYRFPAWAPAASEIPTGDRRSPRPAP